MAKQFAKDLHAQIQNNKELLAKLQPALELKKTRKAALEAELRTLIAENIMSFIILIIFIFA
jgi:hypothetical protein